MLSICTTYYKTEKALALAEDTIRNSKHEWIIVDDGSPEPLRIDYATVYRIPMDVFCNVDAVNLSVMKATNEKVLRLDMDHWGDYDAIDRLEIPHKTIYQFPRICNGKVLKPNPSHILLRKADFVAIGGWSSEYSGHYGYSDLDFLRRARHAGYAIKLAPIHLNVNPNLGTPGIVRDTTRNAMVYGGFYRFEPTLENIWYETVNVRHQWAV
jgi:predicted glycosyltransferase involved in capsule biosynthesis